jgi:four helix bundle protein
MTIRDYRDLFVWQKAMDLVELVYRVTQSFPKEEIYGLTSQVRRAAVSVPSNIAEGQGRFSDQEFRRFLSISHGSLRELETQILIAARLSYMNESSKCEVLALASEVGRLTNGLLNTLNKPQ